MRERADRFDLPRMLILLNDICKDCDDRVSEDECTKAGCLVGFGKKCLLFARQSGTLDIPGAIGLLPKDDFKPYYAELAAPILAETCRQCKECRENHSADCVIALVRTAMEAAFLPETIDYPGSVFQYLALVRQQNADLAQSLAALLRK